MSDKQTALILGTGFAGQGHAEAFRAAGAEIVSIVGRAGSVVQEVAKNRIFPTPEPTGRLHFSGRQSLSADY